MKEVSIHPNSLALFEALASDTRLKMIELLADSPMNIKELAAHLGLSSAIVTKHIQKLEEGGIVSCEAIPAKRGMQKQCHLIREDIVLRYTASSAPTRIPATMHHQYAVSIPVGQYSSYQVRPTCGLASEHKLIGMRDDPRYFAEPEHVKAQHIWYSSGFVEYRIPNYMTAADQISSLSISLEIGSEAPGYEEHWPSDITFEVNGLPLCIWTSPGDFGEQRGKLTPSWWGAGSTQYGLLKTLLVNGEGTFIDGVRMSDVRVTELGIVRSEDILFRIISSPDARHPGGVSLFGRGFGNYEQDIEVLINA